MPPITSKFPVCHFNTLTSPILHLECSIYDPQTSKLHEVAPALDFSEQLDIVISIHLDNHLSRLTF
jgi:hypothetical protein